MKVFKVFTDKCGYEEYDSCVVVAESVEAVWAMMEHKEYKDYPVADVWRFISDKPYDASLPHFYDHQGELHIVEVDLNKPGVILGSFNAG